MDTILGSEGCWSMVAWRQSLMWWRMIFSKRSRRLAWKSEGSSAASLRVLDAGEYLNHSTYISRVFPPLEFKIVK